MIIENLSFKFDTLRQAQGEREQKTYFFKNLSISFAPNTVHFIQGDNGVGKSTFFNILQGAVDKSVMLTGSITLDGVTYEIRNNALPAALTNQIHTVEQQYDRMIAPPFSVMENLQLAHMTAYPRLKPLPQATLFESIAYFNIDMRKPAYVLSGGQRQLLAMLMALQKPTKVLLLDEPTATLDNRNAHLVMQSLHQLATQLKITILVICHDKELVEQYAQGNAVCMRENEKGERRIHVT